MAIRLISAFVGIAIGVTVMIFADTPLMPIAIAFFSTVAVFELYRANGCLEFKGFLALAFSYSSLSPILLAYTDSKYSLLLGTVYVLGMLSSYLPIHNKLSFEKMIYAVATPLFISFSMCSLYKMYSLSEEHGVVYIVLALCGAWIADSAAYFTGRSLGKHKLCPEISPKKTIEGFVGGVIFNGLSFMLFNFVYIKFFAEGCAVNYIASFFLGIICALLGTAGDLSASLIKRQCGIKDYGKIMPGHGGVMDRFDSVFFVAPFMYAYLSVFNIYV